MTRRRLCGLWLLLTVGCMDPNAATKAEKEAEKARKLIATELHVGSSAEQIADFGRRHGWSFRFDDFQQRFYTNIYRAPENTHAVAVYVYVNEQRQLVRSEVKIARAAL